MNNNIYWPSSFIIIIGENWPSSIIVWLNVFKIYGLVPQEMLLQVQYIYQEVC